MADTVTRRGTLLMPEIGVEIPINDLCRGVEPEEPTEEPAPGQVR